MPPGVGFEAGAAGRPVKSRRKTIRAVITRTIIDGTIDMMESPARIVFTMASWHRAFPETFGHREAVPDGKMKPLISPFRRHRHFLHRVRGGVAQECVIKKLRSLARMPLKKTAARFLRANALPVLCFDLPRHRGGKEPFKRPADTGRQFGRHGDQQASHLSCRPRSDPRCDRQ